MALRTQTSPPSIESFLELPASNLSLEKIVECINRWKKVDAPRAASTVGWALFRWFLSERAAANR